jgi:predicted nucleic acid-binding protein
MIYLDTSVLVPLIVPEASSGKARAWRERLSATQRKELAVSAWTLTEFASAMGLKARTRELTRNQGDAALTLLHEVVLPNIGLVEVTATDFRLAEAMLREFTAGLRAGDALHLAIAARKDVRSIAVFDKTLAKVAASLGLKVASI